jgi:hypothetical protein
MQNKYTLIRQIIKGFNCRAKSLPALAGYPNDCRVTTSTSALKN